jgi:hypothetical protein
MEKRELLMTSLVNVSQLTGSLWPDIFALESKAKQEASFHKTGERPTKELCFWYKSLARVFLAQVEGLSYAMRDHAARLSPGLGIQWSRRKWRLISEMDRPMPIEKGLSLGFESFSKLFDVEFSLDSGGEDYRGLQATLAARERFTHPKRCEDLCPGDLLQTTSASMEWVFHTWRSLLLICTEALGSALNSGERPERRFQFRDNNAEQADEPPCESTIESFFGDLKDMLFSLMAETTIALNTLVAALANNSDVSANCAAVLLSMTLFSEIEGSVFIAASHLHRFRSGYPEPSKELLIGKHADVQAHIVSVLESFSVEFGTGASVRKTGVAWESFALGREVRNRLTHPKRAEDLIISAEERQDLMNIISWWHGDVHRCFEIGKGISI